MLPNKPQIEKQTSGFKSTFNLTAAETLADRRSIGDSLDGGSNLEAGRFPVWLYALGVVAVYFVVSWLVMLGARLI